MANHTRKLALGAAQFGLEYGISSAGQQITVSDLSEILRVARKYDIGVVDTAAAYGNSEERLGKAGLSGFEVVTKFNHDTNVKSLSAQLAMSLSQLQAKSVYAYISHNANLLISNPVNFDELLRLKSQGLVRKIGYSLYHPYELEQLLKLDMKPDLIQVPFNILDQRFEQYFRELKEMGTEIHVRSLFLQGLFFMETNRLADFFNPVKALLNQLQRAFGDNGKLAAALLQFATSNKFIDKAVFGVHSADQLLANCQLINVEEYKIPIFTDNIPEEIILPYLWPQKN